MTLSEKEIHDSLGGLLLDISRSVGEAFRPVLSVGDIDDSRKRVVALLLQVCMDGKRLRVVVGLVAGHALNPPKCLSVVDTAKYGVSHRFEYFYDEADVSSRESLLRLVLRWENTKFIHNI